MTVTNNTFTPEERKALSNLSKEIGSLRAQPRSSATQEIWCQGNLTMFPAPFSAKNVPSEKNWRWNQTKSQKHATINGLHIVFAKLIPRKSKSTNPERAPHYKLWQFNIKTDNQHLVAYWCEKGTNQKDIDTTFCPLDESFREMEENKLYAAKISYICN